MHTPTLEHAVLSERSQSKRFTCQMIPFICNVQSRQSPIARKLTGDWLRLGALGRNSSG